MRRVHADCQQHSTCGEDGDERGEAPNLDAKYWSGVSVEDTPARPEPGVTEVLNDQLI